MINKLSIQNFAIVSSLEVEFKPGLNILSGETGAGKSIIIGALNLLLGERAQTEMIRSGEQTAVVEGIFNGIELPSTVAKEIDIETGVEVLEIRREIRQDRASRCFINGQMVTVADLKQIGQHLVDLVGQHHQQLLLNSENHIRFLDQYIGHRRALDDYREKYDRYQKARSDLRQLEHVVAREREKMELYRFQIDEIDSAGLSVSEENDLDNQLHILENAEELKSAYFQGAEELYQSEQAICDRLDEVIGLLQPLDKYDPELKDNLSHLRDSLYNLQEIGRNLLSRSEAIEHDPAQLEKTRERLDQYYELKKKYGGSLEVLFSYRRRIESELQGYTDSSNRLANLEAEIEDLRTRLVKLAEKLSHKRRSGSSKLARQVERNLKNLLMDKVEFEVVVTQAEAPEGDCEIGDKTYRLGPDGIDVVEFRFSPNPGEELKSLAKIASGGELSRVLLAVKSILSEKQAASSLIFDEIDTGLGGRAASAISHQLSALSHHNQVIVITHLQQIAAAGENHYLVYKQEDDGRMITRIRRLTLKQRKQEIGRMISGERISALSLKQAEELLKQKN
jgi:DNA repair protein RecN (Recombination protein N)